MKKEEKSMRRFVGYTVYSPPFNFFLIKTFESGRNIKFEKRKTCGASKERAESG